MSDLQDRIPQGIPTGRESAILTDIVPLAGGGRLGNKGITEVTVEFMVAQDEMMILTPSLIESNQVMPRLITKKVKTREYSYAKALPAHNMQILTFLRNTAYGPWFETTVISPFTNEPQEERINLATLKEKELTVAPDDQDEFSFVLPASGKHLKFKLLNQEEEDAIQKKAEGLLKTTKIDSLPIERMKAMITELDGSRNKDHIARTVGLLPIMDSRAFRKYAVDIEPGLDLRVECTCKQTGQTFLSPFFFDSIKFLYGSAV